MPQWPAERLAAQLRERIASGEITSQLPTIHALMDETGYSSHTVQRALKLLKDAGLVHSVTGLGTFVSEPDGK